MERESKYHGNKGQNTMGRGFNITMGRGVKILWILGLIYHG
jgi:hypothetical protein